jgi:hypothetical protein
VALMQKIFSDLNPPTKHYQRRYQKRIQLLSPFTFPILDPWADQHQFLLYGTQQDANDLYYDGWNPALSCDPAIVPGYDLAINILKTLPDTVVRGLEPQWNNNTQRMEQKAMYCSTKPNRGYASDMPMNYPYGTGTILRDCHTGFVLEQGVSPWDKLAVHEAGHIIDLAGTNRGGYYWTPVQGWEGLADEINAIFDAQGDLISAYANTNSHEDFAVHFCYYVWRGTTLRDKAATSSDVAERYAFLRDKMFLGIEYSNPPPPQPETCSFDGYVVDQAGTPVEGAYIYSRGEAYKGFLVRTAYDGEFHVQGLPAGQYILWAEKSGYTKSMEVEWFMAPGASVNLGRFRIQQIAPIDWVLLLLVGTFIGGCIILKEWC